MLSSSYRWFVLPALAASVWAAQAVPAAAGVVQRAVPNPSGHSQHLYPVYPGVYPGYPSTSVTGDDIEDTTLVNPVIIDSEIEDSTLVNPVIIRPGRRQTTTVIREYPVEVPSSRQQSNPACMTFTSMRVACQ